MPRFICFQRGVPKAPGAEPEPGTQPMADLQAEFAAWLAAYRTNLPDPGGRLGRGAMVLPSGVSEASVPTVAGLAGGYMIVEADDLQHAIAVARACPGLVRPGSGVEVIEIRAP